MHRRGFLGTLMAGAVGLILRPQFTLWQPSEIPDLPPLEPHAITGLNAATFAVLNEMERQLAGRKFTADESVRIAPGVDAFDHFTVHASLPTTIDEHGLNHESIEQIATMMAERAKKLTRIGELDLPHGVEAAYRVKSPKTGLGIRSIYQFNSQYLIDPEHQPAMLLRFDMLGAA